MMLIQMKEMIRMRTTKGINTARTKAVPCSVRIMLTEGTAAAMDRQYHITVDRRYILRH